MTYDVDIHRKVGPTHLKRNAYLYVRQSSMQQVVENTESTARQYALRQRAVALGWREEQVVVIDSDLGQSGASAADREGFKRLVAEVGMGRAGIVMGLEVSRLARNSTDWHRLLEISALTETLILDEDGVYDPAHFNDRLLLGLKGTMSEAELHILRARLRGGLLNKARRGDLWTLLPVGFLHDQEGGVVVDPDKEVQESLRYFFSVFRQTGSAQAAVKEFRRQGIRFPRRLTRGPRKGELIWTEMTQHCALRTLHNPRYAGAFFFGRTRLRHLADGSKRVRKAGREEWYALVRDAHGAYITWEEFEENERRLDETSAAFGLDRKNGPPREGPALLQGILLCGKCGSRMTVRYVQVKGQMEPMYMCQRLRVRQGEPACQAIPGASIDAAVAVLLLQTMTPVALEVALGVQEELRARTEEADRLRYRRVERAQYEADLARRRYMQVDPDNRLVADELEAAWNEKLRDVQQARQNYEKQKAAESVFIGEEQRRKILALATDFPRVWNNPKTPQRDRKRMVRLLIEDVTLLKAEQVTVNVRFKGGAMKTLMLPRALDAGQLRKTDPDSITTIDSLLDSYHDEEVAVYLNAAGRKSGTGQAFTGKGVIRLVRVYGLKTRYQRLRDSGMLTIEEMAELLHVTRGTVKQWRDTGLLRAKVFNSKGECLYEDPGEDAPVKSQGWKLAERRRFPQVTAHDHNEVQHAT